MRGEAHGTRSQTDLVFPRDAQIVKCVPQINDDVLWRDTDVRLTCAMTTTSLPHRPVEPSMQPRTKRSVSNSGAVTVPASSHRVAG